MARLRDGEKDQISHSIHRLIRQHDNGLWESDIAELAQMDRRRVNNYLRLCLESYLNGKRVT